jgi:hypothetical protein
MKCPECDQDLLVITSPVYACSNQHVCYLFETTIGNVETFAIDGIFKQLALEVVNLREEKNPPELPIVASICQCAQCQDMRKSPAAIRKPVSLEIPSAIEGFKQSCY